MHMHDWVASLFTWSCHEILNHLLFVLCSVCVWFFVTPWTVASQAPPSMGFPRQEYWSGLSFPSPEDLTDPGIKLLSPALALNHLGSWVLISLTYWQQRGLPRGYSGKVSACQCRRHKHKWRGWGRSHGVGNGNPLQYSCLENPMDRGAWRATVHGVTKSRTQLSGWVYIDNKKYLKTM